MSTLRLTTMQLKKVWLLSFSGHVNIMKEAAGMGVARNTLRRYLRRLADLRGFDPVSFADFKVCLIRLRAMPGEFSPALAELHRLLPSLTGSFPGRYTVRELWQCYLLQVSEGYRYSQFAMRFAQWRTAVPVFDVTPPADLVLPEIDRAVLSSWRRCSDRRKWEKAVALLKIASGGSVAAVARQTERTPAKVRSWLVSYRNNGLEGLLQRPRRNKAEVLAQIRLKKDNLIRLLHEAPELHGFNRTSWRLKDLSAAYARVYGGPLSVPTISAYIRAEGYVFRKARKVLTSPDPEFREKLTHIQSILGQLGPKEKFFSIDEYGPFSVKMKGGRSRVRRGEFTTYPQHQQSRGCLICTAALELSANQVTHFYSKKKDTAEMIRLIGVLLDRYRDQDKLYLSWDAAVWHASKKLLAFLGVINAPHYRSLHHSPAVELAPLPASAQFLNVIESVFSGLARSVIHHSDYASIGHCQAAIDRYFKERNEHFALHPQKAGRKIWGKERTVAEFRDNHNCKDPAWR